jgi:cation diffusion facilitator family transporter
LGGTVVKIGAVFAEQNFCRVFRDRNRRNKNSGVSSSENSGKPLRVSSARLQRSLRATFLGLAVNVLLTAAKFTAGVIGHSQALIADAVESLADIFSSIIVWRGLVVAETPPDEKHPYGHGKAEPIAAAIVSIMLMLAAGFIAFHSLQGIVEPRNAPSPWTLVVLVGVIALKETLFRFVLDESAHVESSALETDAWHHRADAITSGAAFVGVTIALIGGKGYEAADNWAAIAAAFVIAFNGLRLLRPALSELMDAAPDAELIARIRTLSKKIPGVDDIDKCFVRKMGYQFFVDIHVVVDPLMTVERSHRIGHQVKDQLRAEIPAVRDVLVHIEPLKIGRIVEP